MLGEPAGEEDAGDEHEPAVEGAADGPSHDRAENADSELAVERPGERVADDQAAHELRTATAETETDRAAPVLHHQRQVVELQLVDESFQHRAVLARREPV